VFKRSTAARIVLALILGAGGAVSVLRTSGNAPGSAILASSQSLPATTNASGEMRLAPAGTASAAFTDRAYTGTTAPYRRHRWWRPGSGTTTTGTTTTPGSSTTGTSTTGTDTSTTGTDTTGTGTTGTSTTGTDTDTSTTGTDTSTTGTGTSTTGTSTGTTSTTGTTGTSTTGTDTTGTTSTTGTDTTGTTTTVPVQPAVPVSTAAPTISGTAQQGDALTVSDGSWSGSPTSYSYQWQDCTGTTCTDISGATANTYRLQSSDVGATIDATVTATNAGGSTSQTSDATNTVEPAVPANTAAPTISGTAQQGDALTVSDGSWSGSPNSYSYHWQDCSGNTCTDISGATANTYTLQSTDVGATIDATVTATNAGGSATATTAQTASVQPSSPASGSQPAGSSGGVVGTAGAPSVNCSQTITPSTTIQSALNSAAAGSTICLNGDWTSTQAISATAPSSTVTIAPAPGETATVAGLSIGYGNVANLTFEGIQFTGGVMMSDCISGGLKFLYNNFQDISDQSAFYMYYGGNGDSSCSQTGVTMQHNQIDHTGECLEVDTDTSDESRESGINFSDNVCGPDIGYGCDAGASCNVSGHYVQISNTENDTIDNNAFEGPVYANLNPTCSSDYSHVNVFHETGSSTNLDFSNNVIWHTGACGESVMFQSGSQINDTIDNNLLVENTPIGISFNLYGLDGVTFNHNTTIEKQDGGQGVAITGACTDCGSSYVTPQNVVADYNLTTGGQPSFSSWSCTGSCVAVGNVSDDASALSWGPATSSRGNWTPDFRTTNWSPNSGSPWRPPPTGYYQPANLPTTDGYQGTVGP
jgi:hypothetical protein